MSSLGLPCFEQVVPKFSFFHQISPLLVTVCVWGGGGGGGQGGGVGGLQRGWHGWNLFTVHLFVFHCIHSSICSHLHPPGIKVVSDEFFVTLVPIVLKHIEHD